MQTHAASKISKKINYLQGIIQTKMFGSGVFETWLKKLNRKMAFEKRKMLFLDNASSHPTVEYSNVKLQFFPPNTTSVLQPMDQGIIQATKLKFRKLQQQKHDHRYENA